MKSKQHTSTTTNEGSHEEIVLQCWGYWYPYIDRNGERLETQVLMDDQRGGKLWAIEKHTKIMLCYKGIECHIDGTYRHIH